jgi:photosystem II stability/assembly factor-like uncharacterized protein
VSQTSGTTNILFAVSFTDANTGTAVGFPGTILRTTNGGASWTAQTSGTPNHLYGVSFTDANTGTAVGSAGTIIRTTNGGATWVTQTSGTTIDLYGVSFTDANTGTVVGGNGTILRTTNGGASWTAQFSGTSNILTGVFFTDANTGTAVGRNGTILHTTTGGVVSVQDEHMAEIPKDFILLQNYPNPFNPTTKIQYSVGNRQFVQLKVYDILGNEVATLVNEEKEPGYYVVDFNVGQTISLSSGVYLYRLQAGDFVETKKMILLR